MDCSLVFSQINNLKETKIWLFLKPLKVLNNLKIKISFILTLKLCNVMLKSPYLITGILEHYKWFILLFNNYFTEKMGTLKDAQAKDLEDLKKVIQGEFVLILVSFTH